MNKANKLLFGRIVSPMGSIISWRHVTLHGVQHGGNWPIICVKAQAATSFTLSVVYSSFDGPDGVFIVCVKKIFFYLITNKILFFWYWSTSQDTFKKEMDCHNTCKFSICLSEFLLQTGCLYGFTVRYRLLISKDYFSFRNVNIKRNKNGAFNW